MTIFYNFTFCKYIRSKFSICFFFQNDYGHIAELIEVFTLLKVSMFFIYFKPTSWPHYIFIYFLNITALYSMRTRNVQICYFVQNIYIIENYIAAIRCEH